ncbi:hypothetical protein A6M27_05880 [Acidithiobacillus thiooxidans]|jgi:transposase-like protein|uniref:Transposase n=1 Tax=Acidithiobacillus thiooxidans TaxID=930 RepID=A0A1C2JKF2_ACITH|nr:hypothetical protein A6P07_04740 [Acidithiobacillus thiooxidans]OCX77738.1 hypothetical protein A6O24_06250 [Acidithiobacillus thiooxidans]OCX85360.1 hypothetical protein A6O26_01315 [Acidithiobacillus thiooxidans]OCX88748.1 hypothetical protein A6M27_05880 [Acidithiobacillus thiooxidans]OFC47643.1 hypothetical protein BAE47_08740 [Acidithiobacillus thiooxidans]
MVQRLSTARLFSEPPARPANPVMASGTQRKYQRRSAEGWRALLAQQAVSSLTIGAFCRKASVSTASFYRWRELLQKNGNSGMAAAVTDRVSAANTPVA